MRGVLRATVRARGAARAPGVIGRLLRGVLVIALLMAVSGCGDGPRQDRVTVMVPWSGGEFQAFYSVIRAFEKSTGIQVDVQVTRALTQQLDAAVTAGAPPDLAMLPSPGAIYQYARKDGNGGTRLRPLDTGTAAAYLEPFRSLATVRGTVYAIPVKADVKSLIWYNPQTTPRPQHPTLQTLATSATGHPLDLWCLGLASGPTSGWPGADWIADILLADPSEGSASRYRQWLSGDLDWAETSGAWKAWASMVGEDSLGKAATLEYGEAAAGMTGPRPSCSLAHGTLSAMDFPAKLAPEKGYDFVTFTPGGPLQVSADFVGMFTDNTAAEQLLTYLSGGAAQLAWVNYKEGYAISASRAVRPGKYRNVVQRRIAAMLWPDSGHLLCFSAADAMRTDVSAAFYRAVLSYATGAAHLSDLLRGLQAVQEDRGDSPVVPDDKLCTP
ncbi:ABC transporter substrate-binding protein [Streptomyces odontomachi]|uniref:ABC transporter substrate-binding protein n=1 Tax=Streptomyces odontomachi TaxID=2944940 RepID=UPI00210D6577|nr:ABC transporter substrate-binding protein [Streptomyces sp. ODS25]